MIYLDSSGKKINNYKENFLYILSIWIIAGKNKLLQFFYNRPSRNMLQSKGILKQRVFTCDLGEHLKNTNKDGFLKIFFKE